MNTLFIHIRRRWIACRKSILITFFITLIIAMFMGFREALIEADKLDDELHDEIRQSVTDLEYQEQVAKDFADMVISWKNYKIISFMTLLKEEISKSKEDYTQGKIDANDLAKIEMIKVRQLSQIIIDEIEYKEELFDLNDVVKNKQTNCLGFTQIFYILANSIGLQALAINVELDIPDMLPIESGHVACMVQLADDKMTIVDLAQYPHSIISQPFKLNKELEKKGVYWEFKDKDNPIYLCRKIQIVDRNGLIALIYYNRGIFNNELNQYDKATSNLSKAIELNPNFPEAYYNRGIINHELSKYDKALSDYTKAIELDTKKIGAYTNRGTVYYNIDQYDKAIVDLNIAIELDPNNNVAYYIRGISYFKLQEYEKAISDYNNSIMLDPNNADVYYKRGIAYGAQKNYTQALSDFNTAIKLDPKLADAYFCRGTIYTSFDKWPEAITDLTETIKLDPNEAQAYYRRSQAYINLDKKDEAKKDLLKAVELDPELKERVMKISNHYELDLKLD